MLDLSEQTRPTYQPSGNMSWLLFCPGFLVAVLIAILMAWCMFVFYLFHLYLVLVVPAAAAMATAAAWYQILMWSHCRNKSAAVVGTGLLTLVLYLGWYQLCFLQDTGWQNAYRVDLLPQYILFRIQNDKIGPIQIPGGMAPAGRLIQRPDFFQQAFNCFVFGVELFVVFAMLFKMGVIDASKAYCEPCGRWMRSESKPIPQGVAERLWNAVRQGNVADLQRCLFNTPDAAPTKCSMSIEYCADCQRQFAAPNVYLTLTDNPNPSGNISVAVPVVNQAILNPEEVTIVALAFPNLLKK